MADAASDLLARIAAIDTSGVRPAVGQPAEPPFDPFIPEPDYEQVARDTGIHVMHLGGTTTEDDDDDHSGLIPVAQFPIIGSSYSVGPKGTLRLTLIVDRAHKYDAMPVTDWPGMQLHVVVFRPPLPEEMDTDDGGAFDDD